MGYHTISHHVQVDVDQAADEVFSVFYCRCMIPVFPKSPFALLSTVVFLRSFPGDQLQAFRDGLFFSINHHQVDVVGRDSIVEDFQAVSLLCLEQPIEPAPAVLREPQQEILFVAAVGDVPNLAWDVVTIGSGHLVAGNSLRTSICDPKRIL